MIIERGEQVIPAVTRFDCDWTGRAQSSGAAFPDASLRRT